MSEILNNARAARESLAKGLGALQTGPNSGPDLLAAAEPIAQAMGALHRIERSNGAETPQAAPQALDAIRRALAMLQTKDANDPRVTTAMDAVASALGLVFKLTKLAVPGPAAVQPMAPQMPPPMIARVPGPQAPAHFPAQAQPQAPQQHAYPQAGQAAPMQHAPAPAQMPQGYAPQAPHVQPYPAQHKQPAQPPVPVAPPQAAPVAPAQSALNPYAPTQLQPQFAAPASNAGAQPKGDMPVYEAELGAHSPSNFFKGLSGNDVVDHGGLFVSTYQVPKIGATVRVHVALPGGYEFTAEAVVRWTREPKNSTLSEFSPPGFGAQFTGISDEARQLVYRYVRNREPLFHDDL